MENFLVTLWHNSYQDTPWWGIVISLGVTLPFALVLVGWVIEVPIGFLYALFIWNPDRDQRKREERKRAIERRYQPEIGEARERYKVARIAMLQTLRTWQRAYLFSSVAEDQEPEILLRRMERLWAKKGAWSPYAFWVLWDNQLVLRMSVSEEVCDELEVQVQRLYQDWYAWMMKVGFTPRKTWDQSTGETVYDFQ